MSNKNLAVLIGASNTLSLPASDITHAPCVADSTTAIVGNYTAYVLRPP